MRPAVVCLDAGNTLFVERAGRAQIYADVFAAHGAPVPADTLASWMGAAHEELPELLDGQPRYSDRWFAAFVGRLLQRAGSGADPEAVRAELADVFTRPETYLVHADVFPCLDDLSERGLRLAVVSNWSDRLPTLLAALGLLPYFEVVSVSAVVGRAKPHAAPFRDALRRLGVGAEQALHVGDHPLNDVAGARRAGLQAWLLDRDGGRHADPGADREDDVLASLLELPARLGRR